MQSIGNHLGGGLGTAVPGGRSMTAGDYERENADRREESSGRAL